MLFSKVTEKNVKFEINIIMDVGNKDIEQKASIKGGNS